MRSITPSFDFTLFFTSNTPLDRAIDQIQSELDQDSDVAMQAVMYDS